MYADYTQLMFTFDPNELQQSCKLINNDLEILYSISLGHSLHLDPTNAMFFGRQIDRLKLSHLVHVEISNVNIPLVKEAKVLGVTIDNDLRYESHISPCIKKAIAAV
ncbi:hypothetical protein JTB14_004134 [Gonioctena quinquepunctata]|nr:hypothetical protein JTB14_004134 [Gonioctena quinquepunctata]